MIWSLLRIFLFVGLVGVLAYGASFIAETGGAVTIQFAGSELAVTPVQALLAVVVLLLAIWAAIWVIGICFAVFKFFNGDETAISRYLYRGRLERGYSALTDGMVALASGDPKLAIDKAVQAERYLERPQLTNLLNAQAAAASGDQKRAARYYKRLLSDDQTRFVGVQGLLKQKLDEGDTETALKLAEKAFALKPNHDGTIATLFDLQTENADWKGAQKTIEAHVRSGKLTRDIGKRREAVLAYEDARRLIEAGEIEAGKLEAIKANKLAPAMIPAAILASEMHMLASNARAAGAALRKAWAANPHPDLAAAYAEIAPDETSAARIKRFATLIKANPDHDESKLLAAELALADEDFPAARRAARELAQEKPTTRALSIMAAIEKGEGASDKTVRAWLNKALTAPRGSQWVCENCHQIHSQWSARCANCDGFDTITWKDAPLGDAKPEDQLLGFTAGVLTDEVESPNQSVPEAETIIDPPSENS